MTAPPDHSHHRPRSARERIFGSSGPLALRSHTDIDIPLIWRASQHDAQIYAALVGFGVPLMAYALPGDSELKLWIYFVLLMLSTLYWVIELGEIIVQIEVFKQLNRNQSDHQRGEMRSLYWGAFFAFLWWAFPAAVYAATWKWAPAPVWIGPSYGWADWMVIVHTAIVGALSIWGISSIISIIQEALAGQIRRDQDPH